MPFKMGLGVLELKIVSENTNQKKVMCNVIMQMLLLFFDIFDKQWITNNLCNVQASVSFKFFLQLPWLVFRCRSRFCLRSTLTWLRAFVTCWRCWRPLTPTSWSSHWPSSASELGHPLTIRWQFKTRWKEKKNNSLTS